MGPAYHFCFVLEQALGHVSHAQNLRHALGADLTSQIDWELIPFEVTGRARLAPVYRSNWTIRAGLRARAALYRRYRAIRPDALLFHTQVPAMLALDWMQRIPAVISLDATPLQYDALGDDYDHAAGPFWLESLKRRIHNGAFQRARYLVAWSQWVATSLRADYNIPAERIQIIPPGINAAYWASDQRRDNAGPVRILFVGGDLERKGGNDLIAAFRALRAAPDLPPVELHLVTRSAVTPEPGITVYNAIQPNSPQLRELYQSSDIFCLPTRADCLPLVLAEAGAAGLPLVATPIAAIPDIVREGETGLHVRPRDPQHLAATLRTLVEQPNLRRELGERAARLIAADHNAERNAQRVLDLLKQTADEERARQAPGVVRARPPARQPQPTLLTVSGTIDPRIEQQIAQGRRPRADYLELAAACRADLLDYAQARREQGWIGRAIERLAGPDVLLALATFRRRKSYQAILTDGEQVGIPLAALLKLFGGRQRPRHLMINHVLSVPKKLLPMDALKLHTHIDRFLTYATAQQRFIRQRWNLPAQQVRLTPFMVDTRFFSPQAITAAPRRMLCAVGLERRDYPTLIEAARGLDAEVVIAAASPWSKRADSTAGQAIPANVTVRRFSQFELRQLYADSRFLVMPLEDVDFQAGVTAILEAMALGRAVICTRTPGQTDVVVDGETGLYVPPRDPQALRAAIDYLLEHPDIAQRMGEAGRARVERLMSLDHYAEGIAAMIAEVTPMEVSHAH